MRVATVESWKTIALRAVAAALFGVLTLIWPGLTLWVLVLLWGSFALVDGAMTLMGALRKEAPPDGRTWPIVSGVVSIAAGLITFLWPGITALALLFVIAAWAITRGLFDIVAAVRLRRALQHEWLLGLSGVLSIAFGALLVITPGAGALVITWIIGWFALLYAGLLAALAWRTRSLEHGVGRPVSPFRPATA
jgi:uncharacterized membrane protein HdeD (DUF308 family)